MRCTAVYLSKTPRKLHNFTSQLPPSLLEGVLLGVFDAAIAAKQHGVSYLTCRVKGQLDLSEPMPNPNTLVYQKYPKIKVITDLTNVC